jgi:hypothetical protein
MFTNEVVRTAMQGLVAEKGERHTSYGKYMDPMTGKGACFLGALCEFMGMAIPHEGSRARDVLGKGAVSREMGDAFSVAQALNDAHFEWKYVLLGVDLTLKVSPSLPLCPCGCGVSEDFSGILDEVQRRRALDRTKEPTYPGISAYASGGIITGGIMPTFASTSSMAQSFSALSVALADFTEACNAVSMYSGATYPKTVMPVVVTKKDHALVA